jgi:hypothetical protein
MPLGYAVPSDTATDPEDVVEVLADGDKPLEKPATLSPLLQSLVERGRAAQSVNNAARRRLRRKQRTKQRWDQISHLIR